MKQREFLFSDPSLARAAIGSTEWFEQQRVLIASRPLVKRTYESWYRMMLGDAATVPIGSDGAILEIGSGSGYVKTVDASVITSDIVEGHSDMVVDAHSLPFGDASLRAILLTHVFHHIPDVSQFLEEADRVLVPGGVISMIDVARSTLAKILFGKFHPEAYDESARQWKLDTSQPQGGANQALSWIVFTRDRAVFEQRFPTLRIESIEPLPWLAYLVSGGVTRRNFVPNRIAPLIAAVDGATQGWARLCALHWHIRIRKIAAT